MDSNRITASLLTAAVVLCTAGCPRTRPVESVETRLAAPIDDRSVEAAVRAVPGVRDVQVRPNSAAYTLGGKPIPVRDTILFRAPDLAGALGSVSQNVDPRDRTTTTVRAQAQWLEQSPTAADRRAASRVLRELMGWILLTAEPGEAGGPRGDG